MLGLRTWAGNPLSGAEQVFLGRGQFTFLISKVANWLGCQPTSKDPTGPKAPWSSAAGAGGQDPAVAGPGGLSNMQLAEAGSKSSKSVGQGGKKNHFLQYRQKKNT